MDLSTEDSAARALTVLEFCLCRHYMWDKKTIRRIAECRTDHDTPLTEFRNAEEVRTTSHCETGTCGFVPICPGCPRETSIQKFNFEPDRSVMVVTQWRDLGTCSTPEDLVWRAHTAPNPFGYGYPSELRHWQWATPKWGLGFIKERFEAQPGITVQDLTVAHLRILHRGPLSWEQ